jgi:MFS transporter, MHS family, proline/betaine transporter
LWPPDYVCFGTESDEELRGIKITRWANSNKVLVYPHFSWLHDNPSFGSLATVQIILCCLLGVFFDPISTAVAKQFVTRSRSTGLGIAYNLAVMIFGGFAQFFVTWLIEVTGSPIAPSFYVMFGAAIGVVATFFLINRAWDAQCDDPPVKTMKEL